MQKRPDPLGDLIKNLNKTMAELPHDDVAMSSGGREVYKLEPSNFVEIQKTDAPRKIAFIDGGNGTIASSPNFVISFNRIYYCIFQGKKKLHTLPDLRVQFFSQMHRVVKSISGQNKITYNATLFPYDISHKRYLPDVADINKGVKSVATDDSRVYTLPRSLGEWRLALKSLDSLDSGDVLVMDGSLTTISSIERNYADILFEKAQRKDVTVCAISKTTRLLTKSGEPLLNRINEISKKVKHDMWRLDVVRGLSPHDPGFVMAIKLHPQARFSFRFEILQKQHEQMDDTRINDILSGLAANSDDMSFLGYPYGLVDADRFAQVRNNDIQMYCGLLESKMRTSLLSKVIKNIRGFQAHDRLNEVTS